MCFLCEGSYKQNKSRQRYWVHPQITAERPYLTDWQMSRFGAAKPLKHESRNKNTSIMVRKESSRVKKETQSIKIIN